MLTNPEWGKVPTAARIIGLSRASVYKLIFEPKNNIRTFVHKAKSDAKTGARLVHIPSLVAYVDRQAKAAEAAQAAAMDAANAD